MRFILVVRGISGTKTECETRSVNNTSTSSALKKVLLLCPWGVTVSSMNLDSSFPMPFSFHHFIEKSQRYWPPSKQALNPLNMSWHMTDFFPWNISSFPLNTVFHFCKECELFTWVFLQKTQDLWFYIYSLYTRLRLMVMDRTIMHCMGNFVTPISAVSVTLAISSFNWCKLWHPTKVLKLNTIWCKTVV